MSGSPVLGLVILLTFIYFIGSLILSAINEAIAGTFRLRPKNLQTALERLSFSPDWKPYVRDILIKSPHLEALMKEPGRYPAYIAAENFILAIIQQIGAGKYDQTNLASAINSSDLPAGFKQVLSDIAAKSQYDITQFEKELKTFYDNAMDRASGWYKRKIRLILMIIAFALAFLLNLDTIRLSKTIQYQLDTSNYLGYAGWDDFTRQWGGNNGANFLVKLLGILITAFALQMGSNYWFGLLTKNVDLRAAGKKPV